MKNSDIEWCGKERPILFSGPMVRAILAGRKTQTRRIVKNPTKCRYGATGDRLWVREAFDHVSNWYDRGPLTWYRADGSDEAPAKWKPSIHMPRVLSRITLEIIETRIEKLFAISESDAQAEGVESSAEFFLLWHELHGAFINVDVHVISFRVIQEERI